MNINRIKKLTVFLLALTMLLSFIPAVSAEAKTDWNNTDVTFYFKSTAGVTLSNGKLTVQQWDWWQNYSDYKKNVGNGFVQELNIYDYRWRLVAGEISGYEFDHWSYSGGVSFEAGSTESYISPHLQFVQMQAGSITAYYRPYNSKKYTLTVNQTTGGTVTAENSTNDINGRKLTAFPYTGYAFDKWQYLAGSNWLDYNQSNPLNLTLTSDLTLKALFKPITYQYTITTDGQTFYESDRNDGVVAGTRALLLSGAAFAEEDFVSGTHYTVSGVPSGLTAVVKRASDRRLQLYFTGSTNTSLSNPVVTLTLLDQAFNGGSASGISGLEQKFTLSFFNYKTIRVLEVYPSSLTGSDGDYKDAATQLSGSTKYRYEITSMSMNEFISKTDEVNGNYDVVYFGRGRYLAGGVNDLYYGNDITQLAADKVLDFIGSGQLCIFHTDAFKLDATASRLNLPTTIMSKKFNVPAVTSRANVRQISGQTYLKTTIETYYNAAASNKRPVIDLIDNPYSYRDNSLPFVNNSLEFTFRASDPDSTAEAKLTAKLYIDKNNDSKFDGDNEEVAVESVVNEKYHTFIYSMPDGLTGVFFWKITVEDENGAKDEFKSVFRLKGEEIHINVLQVTPNGNTLDLKSRLDTKITGTNDTFGHRTGEYKINLTTTTISEFNNPSSSDPYKIKNLNGTYDMIIFGFADEYGNNDIDSDAKARLESFISTGQSVMFTHDTIEWNGYNSDKRQYYRFNSLKDRVGQTNTETATQIIREFTGGSTISSNYGLAASGYGNFNTDPGVTQVKLVNSTPLTLYPFYLENTPPASTNVAKTHYQYYKLNLEDKDVIPVYNLYRSDVSGRATDDAMNSYYTYSYGTITYSGTGHSQFSSSYGVFEFELQLFVNTMLKAYTGANHAPIIEIFTPQDNAILDIDRSTFSLSFKGSDFDFGDDTLYYSIYISSDGGATYKLVGAKDTPMANGSTVTMDINKAAYGISATAASEFKVKIEMTDSSDSYKAAKSVKEITLQNSAQPKLLPTLTTASNVYLVGDTVSFSTGITASGNSAEGRTIQPSLSLDIPAALTASGNIETKAYTDVPQFVFTTTGAAPISYTSSDTKALTLTKSGSYTFTARCEYNSGSSDVTQTASTGITVQSGKVVVRVYDDKGNPMENVEVYKNAVSTGKTGAGGSLLLDPVARGEYDYSVKLPSGYRFSKVSVTSNNGTAAESTTIPKARVNMNTDSYEWIITYVLKLDVGIDINYYKLEPDKTLTPLIDSLNVMKNTKVTVIALFKLPDIGSVGVDVLRLTMNTMTDSDNAATEKIFTQLSGGTSLTVPDGTAITLTAKDPRLMPSSPSGIQGLTALAEGNAPVYVNYYNSNPANGSYAGENKWYYTAIEINGADNQRFSVESVFIHMVNGSSSLLTTDGSRRLSVRELAPPVLK